MSDFIDEYTGQGWSTQDITDGSASLYIDAAYNRAIFALDAGPILNLSGASFLDANNAWQPIPLTGSYIDARSRQVFVPFSTAFPGWGYAIPKSTFFRFSYRAGYATVPSQIKQAVALLVQEWVQADYAISQGQPGFVTSYSLGDYRESYGTVKQAFEGGFGLGTSLSQRAKMILDNLLGVGVVFAE